MDVFPNYAQNPLDTLETGNITALNEAVTLVLAGHKSATTIISGTWVGTLVAESSTDDGVTWVQCWLQNIAEITAYAILRPINTVTTNGAWAIFNTSGITHYRIRASAWTSGTAVVGLTATEQPPSALFASTTIVQNVLISAGNSSTTNLSSGNSYTFTGVADDTLGVVGLQVSLFADKNCTVQIQQSPDGTNWDIIDVYTYSASSTAFGITVQAVNSYVRVVVITNNETTTVFRLQTVLCPIVEALPRSLDINGNLKVATPTDNFGNKAEITPMGDLRSVTPSRLVGVNFEGTTIDPNFWTTATAGTGASIAQSNSQILLTSGTASGATVSTYTVRRARYVGGYSMRYRSVVMLGAGQTNNVRRWGIGWGSSMPTVTDGAYFQISGSTFSVVTMKGGAATVVTNFNGNLGGTYSPNSTVKTYEIYWTNSKVQFVVEDVLLHTVTAPSDVWSNTMTFHAFMYSNNSAAATSTTLSCRVVTIHRLGQLETDSTYKNVHGAATTIMKYSAGRLHRINNNAGLGDAVVYDNTAGSGTIIGSLTFNNNQNFEFGCSFSNGLTIVTTGSGCDITVIYE